MPKPCDICPVDSVAWAADDCDRVYYACSQHRVYLAGWVRDANYESYCDSEASRRYDHQPFGED